MKFLIRSLYLFILMISVLPRSYAIGPDAIPSDISNSVNFWKKIYVDYTSDQRVFYNRNHPEQIYGVLDLSSLRKKSKSAVQFEIKSKELIYSEIKKYRIAFKLADKGFRSAKEPDVDRILQSILSSQKILDHKHSFKEQKRSLRIQTGQRDHVDLAIKRSAPYRNEIMAHFKRSGIPSELFFLSFVESSFNPKAQSRSGAVGVWQFLEVTGKKFLKINLKLKIDERKDPIASSVAAGRLLQQNFTLLSKSWPLAITAYHHGFKHLIRIPKKARKTDELFSYFRLCSPKGKIGWASRNYYSEFRAMVLAVDAIEKEQARLAQN